MKVLLLLLVVAAGAAVLPAAVAVDTADSSLPSSFSVVPLTVDAPGAMEEKIASMAGEKLPEPETLFKRFDDWHHDAKYRMGVLYQSKYPVGSVVARGDINDPRLTDIENHPDTSMIKAPIIVRDDDLPDSEGQAIDNALSGFSEWHKQFFHRSAMWATNLGHLYTNNRRSPAGEESSGPLLPAVPIRSGPLPAAAPASNPTSSITQCGRLICPFANANCCPGASYCCPPGYRCGDPTLKSESSQVPPCVQDPTALTPAAAAAAAAATAAANNAAAAGTCGEPPCGAKPIVTSAPQLPVDAQPVTFTQNGATGCCEAPKAPQVIERQITLHILPRIEYIVAPPKEGPASGKGVAVTQDSTVAMAESSEESSESAAPGGTVQSEDSDSSDGDDANKVPDEGSKAPEQQQDSELSQAQVKDAKATLEAKPAAPKTTTTSTATKK